jgi:tripartite-type tricarboxylate transporter receptor subunit TctC
MQKAVQQALQMPEVREQLSRHLWVQPHFRTGAEMDQLQRAELAHWEPIIKASGFKPD